MPVERYSLLGHFDYEFADRIGGFVEASFQWAEGDVLSAQLQSFVRVLTALNLSTIWIQRLTTDQHVAAINFGFEPVTLWAGRLSVAFGGEYRKESAFATVDSISQAGGFQTGNVSPIDGDIEVVEGYLEIGAPLLRDSVIGKALDLNGAVRRTHYDTSGSVTTWKIGGARDVIDGIRFRGTRSRDIRAPNVNELFTDPTFTANSIVDPRSSLQMLIQVTGGGNPTLKS